jgi:hypothetical protein
MRSGIVPGASRASYYRDRIKACGLSLGMRVGIGNGADGVIVAFGPWVQGVCVKVDGGHPTWAPYENVIKR